MFRILLGLIIIGFVYIRSPSRPADDVSADLGRLSSMARSELTSAVARSGVEQVVLESALRKTIGPYADPGRAGHPR